MVNITSYPALVFVISFVVLAISARLGVLFSQWRRIPEGGVREDFGVIQAATLTLLGLIIGFTFSMALNRYDQRKNLEEEEANAIGPAYLRADLVAAPHAAKLRDVLKQYAAVRVRYYTTRDRGELDQANALAGKLQGDMWAAVRDGALENPNPLKALAVASINDVVNS